MTTTLVRWSPFQEFETLERRMRRMLGDIAETAPIAPAADVYETDEQFVVELEVPGFVEKELTVDVSDHTLAIKGERKIEKETKEKAFLLHERLEKTFERRFTLPAETDPEHMQAAFDHGVLTVRTPKKLHAGSRTVEITSA